MLHCTELSLGIIVMSHLVSAFERIKKWQAHLLAGGVVFFLSVLFVQTFFAYAEIVPSNEVQVYVRPSVTCFASPSSASTGQTVTFTSNVLPSPLPAGQSYRYSWSSAGATLVFGDTVSPSYVVRYGSAGPHDATLTVTPIGVTPPGSESLAQTASCSVSVYPPSSFNYSISAGNVAMKPNETRTTIATLQLISGTTEPVTLAISRITSQSGAFVTGNTDTLALGSGNTRFSVTVASPNGVSPTASINLQLQTQTQTPLVIYTVELTGTASVVPPRTKTFTVTVSTTGSGPIVPKFEEF